MMVLLIYIGYRIVISFTAAKKTPPRSTPGMSGGEETHCDPVCGIYVTEDNAVIGTYQGERHYFCSMECLDKYREQLDHISPS